MLRGTRIVKVKGGVQEYPQGSGKYSILIDPRMEGYIKACPETEYDLSDFIRVSKRDRDIGKLKSYKYTN